jgi:two-component system, cell cycle sensor histidine kinase and response regulator CckA
LDRLLDERIRVVTQLADDLPNVRADGGLIHQILLNLAVNARDAMPNGGTIRVKTERTLRADRTFVRISLSDTGTGMDDITQQKAFEPFYTTKEIGKGTGLGLATVYGIVQQLEGEIRLQSTLGIGTTFEIDLPATGVTSEKDRSQAENLLARLSTDDQTPIPANRVALLVEDDDMVRDLIDRLLSLNGYRVLSATSPIDGIALARKHKKLNLIVTDLALNELSGVEMVERIDQFRSGLRVVFISGHSPEELERLGLQIPAEDELNRCFIQKPFTAENFLARIVQLSSGTLAEIDLGPPR